MLDQLLGARPSTSGRGTRRRWATRTAVAAAAATALALTGCGGSDKGGGGGGDGVQALRDKGVVRIGVSEFLPTTGYNGSTPTGIFPELAAQVFNKMGVKKAEFVKMEFGALIPSLQAGRIDVAAGGLYVFKDRCNAINFSEPKFSYLEAMAVPKGNPKGITTYEDVAKKGIQLGVISGAAEIPLAKAAGVKDSKMQKYPDLPSLLDAVKAGRVDAGAYDNVTIAYFVSRPAYSSLQSTKPYAPGEQGAGEPSGVSIGFKKGADDLTQAFDKAQDELDAQNAFDGIYKKWNVPKVNIGVADGVTLKTLCD